MYSRTWQVSRYTCWKQGFLKHGFLQWWEVSSWEMWEWQDKPSDAGLEVNTSSAWAHPFFKKHILNLFPLSRYGKNDTAAVSTRVPRVWFLRIFLLHREKLLTPGLEQGKYKASLDCLGVRKREVPEDQLERVKIASHWTNLEWFGWEKFLIITHWIF